MSSFDNFSFILFNCTLFYLFFSYHIVASHCEDTRMEPLLLVHGGAGNIAASRVCAKIKGVKHAAYIGYNLLKSGESAISAVEAAVRDMEDDPAFNCGYGSVLNEDGEVEMDASIMNGKNLESGTLGAMKDISHPISLARLVMEKTPHVMLVSEGAKRFAISQNITILPPGSLVTESALKALEQWRKIGGSTCSEIGKENPGDVGTVGAVAIDQYGHIAVATSTGGTNGKMVGRVGDTPILGSGSYADNNLGAVSSTGHGESIMKYCLAYAILNQMGQGKGAQESTKFNIDAMTARLNNTAGAITISNKGDVGIAFSSERMAWAYRVKNELHYGIEQNQHETELVSSLWL